MTQEELKILGEKVAAGQASPAEKLALLKEMNATIEGLRSDISSLKASQEISNNL
ncbi:MAG: hypothetical protein NTX66_02620 [Candidatus Falkowbacteria bacterium]|nr:hypothetical protein [Candidatus Falkowbacteria bacterium]